MKLSSGFTFIELCIVIAITLTLSTVGLFAIRDYQEFQKTTYIISALKQTIYYARLQATFNYQEIEITPNNHQWQQGWTIGFKNKILKKYASMPLPMTSNRQIIKIKPDGTSEGSNLTFEINNKIKCIINNGGRLRIEK